MSITDVTSSFLTTRLTPDTSTNPVLPCPGGAQGRDPRNTLTEFSTQNIVNLFLTLTLCLLTQPYGSLLYKLPPSPGPKSRLRHALFSLWRLNPLACLAETTVILVGLTNAMQLALQDPERLSFQLPSISRKFPYYHSNTEKSKNWTRHWHLHAAALLIIRGNPGENSNGDLLARFIASEPSETSPSPSTSTRHASDMESSNRLLKPDDIELGSPSSREQNFKLNQLTDLHKLLGTNVQAHKVKSLDLVTTFSILKVTIKLITTTIPSTVRLPALFLLSNWCSVQLLLHLLHLSNLDASSPARIIKTIHQQKTHLNSHSSTSVILVLSAPLLWLGYNAGFPSVAAGANMSLSTPIPALLLVQGRHDFCETSPHPFLYWLILSLPWIVTYSLVLLSMFFASYGPAFIVVSRSINAITSSPLNRQDRTLSRNVIVPLLVVSCVVLGIVFVGGAWWLTQWLLTCASAGGKTTAVINMLVGIVVLTGTCISLAFCLFSSSSRFVRVPYWKRKQDNAGLWGLSIGTILSLCLFEVLLWGYDSQGTYEPSWLTLLG